MIDDQELFRAYMHEIKELEGEHRVIHLMLKPTEAMTLVGAIQLACRHPRFTGSALLIAVRIVDWIQLAFIEYRVPAVLEVIRMGWDKKHDSKKEN